MNQKNLKAEKRSNNSNQPVHTILKKPVTSHTVQKEPGIFKRILENRLLLILIISFIGTSVYFRTVNFDFTMDDVIYTKSNEAVNGGISRTGDLFSYGSLQFFTPQPINSGTYRPLTLLTFAIEKDLSGEFNPVTGHLVNIFLYFVVLISAGILLTKLFQSRGIPHAIPMLILLVYALHPTHTEVVASIKSRDTLLCALFAFVSLNAFYNGMVYKKLSMMILAGVLFFMSLLSKEESLPLLMIAFVIPIFFLKKSPKESIYALIPFLVSAIVYLGLRFMILDADQQKLLSIVNNIVYRTEGFERLMTNLKIWLHYIGILIWPFNLSYDYSFNQFPIVKSINPTVILSLLFFALLVVLSVIGFIRRTVTGFAIIFYLVTFSIFSNIIPQFTIGSTLAERFLFIPSLGFSILLVYGFYLLVRKTKNPQTIAVLTALLAPVLISYYAYSYSRTGVWKNNDTLFTSGVTSSPDSWRTHLNLANHLFLKGRNYLQDNPGEALNDSVKALFAHASNEFRKGISIYGGYVNIPGHHTDMGYCYLLLKDTVNARLAFTKEIQLYPDSNDPYYYLGLMAIENNQYQKGIRYLNKSLSLGSPKKEEILNKLAQAYISSNDTLQARKTYELVLKEFPGNSEALFNLGLINFTRGNYNSSIEYFNKSLAAGSYRQFDIYQNIARSYFKTNQVDKAIAALESSLPYKVDKQTYGVLSFLYQQKGNSDKASYYSKLATQN